MTKPITSVAFIGFGEVGRVFTRDLRAAGIEAISAFDIAFAERTPQLLAAHQANVRVTQRPREAVAGADLVISAVTAGSDLDAARSCAGLMAPGTLYLDVNSVAPDTKVEAARIVEDGGGRYVEAAVMAPVEPRGLSTPILLGGTHATAFLACATTWKLDAKLFSDRIGAASSVKMCRSIMIKGLEALALECTMTAHHYGVLDAVLASLSDTFPGLDWHKKAQYLVSRSLIHGRRRAEEMREVAKTIADAGLEPVMTRSTVAKQDFGADLGAAIGGPQAAAAALGPLLVALEAGVAKLSSEEGERCRAAS